MAVHEAFFVTKSVSQEDDLLMDTLIMPYLKYSDFHSVLNESPR